MLYLLLSCHSDTTKEENVDVKGDETSSMFEDIFDSPSVFGFDDVCIEEEDCVDSEPDSEFALEVWVELEDHILGLWSNQPISVDSCEILNVDGLDCSDVDLDGLTDVWEEIAMTHLRPILLLDEQEPFVYDPTGYFAQIIRISPHEVTNEWIDLYSVLAWSEDYGRCGITDHHGDSERIVIRLQVDYVENTVYFWNVYTAGHEGTLTDTSRIWNQEEMIEFDFMIDENTSFPRWIVYPSEAKHATFATIDHCEQISFIPCLDEDCAPDNVISIDDWYLFGEAINVGEEQTPLVDDLSDFGFLDERAWANQDFCGGLGGSNCSSSILEKLTSNPFSY